MMVIGRSYPMSSLLEVMATSSGPRRQPSSRGSYLSGFGGGIGGMKLQAVGPIGLSVNKTYISSVMKEHLMLSIRSIPVAFTWGADLMSKASTLLLHRERKKTTVILAYIQHAYLRRHRLGPEFAIIDRGTYQTLLDAPIVTKSRKSQKFCKIPCIDEVFFKKCILTKTQLMKTVSKLVIIPHGVYLISFLRG